MKNPLDLRAIKTREKLVGAYLELLVLKTSIKVLDICNRAKISNITFYHHFGDKNQLTKYVVDYQLQSYLPIPKKLKPNGNKQLFIYLIGKLTLFFIQNRNTISSAIKYVLNKGYKYSYLDVLNKTILYQTNNELVLLDKQINPELRSIIVTWFIGGLLVTNYLWIINNKILNPELFIRAIKVFASIINRINNDL